MLTGSVPFETPMHAIHSPFHVTRELEKMSVEGFELLNWMLVKDANKRPNIQQVSMSVIYSFKRYMHINGWLDFIC